MQDQRAFVIKKIFTRYLSHNGELEIDRFCQLVHAMKDLIKKYVYLYYNQHLNPRLQDTLICMASCSEQRMLLACSFVFENLCSGRVA